MDMGDGDPRVSAVMITHNRRDEVLRTLEHMTGLPERPRVVMVDNASSDDTVAAVRACYGPPAVQVIEAGRNLGASGRNLGVGRVSTPYVAFCDDDSWYEPGGLSHAADLFDAHPRLAVVTGRVLVGPSAFEDPTCALLRDSPLPREEGMPGPPLLGFLAGASVVRRSAFEEVGGFDAKVLVGGEEEWMAADLVARGYWLCYVPAITVHHFPSPVRDVNRRRWQGVRNALWFAWLRRPWPSALRRTAWLLRNHPTDRWLWQGVTAALAGLPRLACERRVVPPHVEQGLRRLDPW